MTTRGTFELSNPDSVDMTLTITMSIGEWKIIKQRLQANASNGEWYLNDALREMLDKANKEFRFYKSTDEEKQ